MKKYFKLYILVLAAIAASCDYLDVIPDNMATIDNAFTDRYNAEKYLATCYSFLPNYASRDGNPGISCGDEQWLPEKLRNQHSAKIARGNQSVTSPSVDYWVGEGGGKSLYKGIRTCNTFISRIDEVPDLSGDEKIRWKAEVTFLKAYYHFYLIRMYGPIHITKESIEVYEQTQATRVYRDPIDDCFKYVIELLDDAIVNLPEVIDNRKDELGRITKPIAAAIKARVLMTYASPLFNGNGDFESLVDNRGTKLFPSVYDADRWVRAAEACKEAIDFAHAASFKLYEPEDVFTPYSWTDTTLLKVALRKRISEEWNVEAIWQSTSGMVGGLQSQIMPRFVVMKSNPVRSQMAVPLKVAEQYYSKNGVPINEDKTYNYEGRYEIREADSTYYKFIKYGEQTASLNFDREFRFYSDLGFDRGIWFGNGAYKDEDEAWYLQTRKGDPGAVYDQYDRNVSGYFAKKMIHFKSEYNSDATSYRADSYPFPVVRLADLYLYYAEALNEVASAPSAEVYQWIDQVRARAGLEGVVESWTKYSTNPSRPTTKEGMRSIIHRERLIEMSFEGGRFWDLRRWKLAYKYQNQAIKGWNVTAKEASNYYLVNTVAFQEFTVRDYFWPIKENELIHNPNLVQNVGW